MSLPKMHPETLEWLIRTLVQMAHIDGRVVPVEGALVERVMKMYDAPAEQHERVKKQLRKVEPYPAPGKPPAHMSYEDKLECFREVTELVFADGVLHKEEEAAVMKLANTLGLHPGDMQPIWNRAKRHWDGTRTHRE